MVNDLFEITKQESVSLKESDELYNELYQSSRADKKRSLRNIKAALDYLFEHHVPSSISYNIITEFISKSPGLNTKEKTPKSGQQIKNDVLGMKKYVDLRKLEEKGENKKLTVEPIVRAEKDKLLQEDK